MPPIPATLTDDLFVAFLKCRYKAYVMLRGTAGESDYQQLQARLAAEYRIAARQEMLRTRDPASVIVSPPLLADALRSRPALILDAPADDADGSCRLDALERSTGGAYTPILFAPHQRVVADDRLRLAFGASVLARLQGQEPTAGRIVHGPQFRPTRVSLPTLARPVRDTIDQLRVLQASASPPPLMLNRHCTECEFRRSCRASAIETDHLSLLRGLTPKEIVGLNRRGIFTVTQYSYTFRPGRLKRAAERAARKHDQSLQALAVREGKLYVARRPEVRDARMRAYLDVEGLPGRDFYYLVGLSIDDGTARRHVSLWADQEADERGMWDAFLAAIRGLGEEFVLFHYGSYEAQFLKRMADRYGGDPEVIARLGSRAVNILSAIHGRVYFPVHTNDLKSVAGCLGFRWSAAEASGLQAIVWRHEWEAAGGEATKQRLLTYNQEDCSALEAVVAAVRSLGGEPAPGDDRPGPPVAGVDEIDGPTPRKYGRPKFALPAFAGITKCAYFDYQRDKVLCRTNPAVKRIIRRKSQAQKPTYRVNQEIVCERPSVCPHCGSDRINTANRGYQKVVVDLKPSRSGLKRWVIRYKTKWYRCPKCHRPCVAKGYPTYPGGYGWGVHSWIIYSLIGQRQTHESVLETLRDQFGIVIRSPSYMSSFRRRAVEGYRATYESLLSSLRSGPLIHADETKVELRAPKENGYVLAFASPDTAVYVYAPTREGTTITETLKGFKGVLVSDFYAAYDAVECPQQKCLIHLIRDLNDDLLKNPFDEELKQVASRFTAVLQPVIATIDRFGLKKYHLAKHKREVDRYFDAESQAKYTSDLGRHYRARMLKYRDKLFTFLDYDGVPWNNNNAENAVKLFASRRKVMGSLLNGTGIRSYLLLLSIYQTLRYRNLSFWKFLLSGETDIDAFAARSR